MVLGLNTDTPLEEYKIKGKSVWVKRDDLMARMVLNDSYTHNLKYP